MVVKLTVWQTSDKIDHYSLTAAIKHADKRYGYQLTKMSHQLIRIYKYSEMVDKLDGFKGSMRLLLELAEDCELPVFDDGEDE